MQQTDGGSLERVAPGVFRLRLTGVAPDVATFTDRPRRRAGDQDLGKFVDSWRANGFTADPPNAALVVHGAPRSRDVAVLTLSRPRYDRGAETVTYRATPLHGDSTEGIAALARRGDPVGARDFGAASLFIDDGGGPEYRRLEVQVSGMQGGERFELEVHRFGSTGSVAFSLGAPGTVNCGFSLRPSSFEFVAGETSLTHEQVSVETLPNANGGGSVSIELSLCLEGEDVSSFFLSAPATPSARVVAEVGAGGGQVRPVAAVPTAFPWNPF